ncbi:cytochrome P450 3A24-like [Littorina saxatilis]
MELWTGVDVPVSLLLLPLALILLYVYATWPFGQLQSLGISGPPPQPFFGNQRQLTTKGQFYALLEWSKKYGRVYGIYVGRQPMIVVSDLDILKEVMVKDFGHFTDRFNQTEGVMSEVVKKGVFFAGGVDWKRIRNIITPTFSAGKLKMMEHFINRCSVDLTENLEAIARRGGKVDVKEYFGAYTMDVITGTAFGVRVNSQEDLNEPLVTNMKKMLGTAGRFNFLLYLFLIFPWLAPGIRFLRSIGLSVSKNLTFLIDSTFVMIDQRKADNMDEKRHVDFLQLLINAEASDGSAPVGSSKRLTRKEIAGQIFVFYVAAYETTSTTLQYLAYNLAMHPDVQDKVVMEIEQQLGEEDPSYENVAKLKYMEQTINETLRLFPPVTTVSRMASETVHIKGVTIPKGCGVLIPICDILRDPQHFPDPEAFNPDRFSSANKAAMDPLAFIPFGYGPRLCIGQRLALLEIKIAMVHVLRKMRFVKTPDLPEKVKFRTSGGLLPPATPLMVKTVTRDKDHVTHDAATKDI